MLFPLPETLAPSPPGWPLLLIQAPAHCQLLYETFQGPLPLPIPNASQPRTWHRADGSAHLTPSLSPELTSNCFYLVPLQPP